MKGMMKPLYLAAGLLLAAACARPASLADEALDYCVKKVAGVQERLGADYGESPRNIAPGDCRWNLTPVCQENWTMGFWPGILWYAYEASGDAALETAGQAGADGIRTYIDSSIPPPNSPVTVNGGWIYNRKARKCVYVSGKGFNKPLFDTGALYDAFGYEVSD